MFCAPLKHHSAQPPCLRLKLECDKANATLLELACRRVFVVKWTTSNLFQFKRGAVIFTYVFFPPLPY